MKKLLIALGLLIGSIAPAAAQNTTCSDRPSGDISNACANTRFVQNATGSAIPFTSLHFTQTGTGAVDESADAMYRNKIYYPEMFSDTPNTAVCGIPDAGPAIQRAINAAGSLALGPGAVQLAPCAYTVITPVIDSFGVRLLGSNLGGTFFVFQPASAGQIAYRVRNAGHIVSNGGMENITFYTNDTAFVKVAIDIEDISRYSFKNVKVSGNTVGLASLWGDVSGASIGLRTRGREYIRADGLELNANRPLVIAKNPNSTIDLDVSDFRNVNLVASNGNNGIHVDDALSLTRNNFTNIHVSGGTNCIYWINTTGTIPSDGNTINNFGCEQPGTGATGYNYVIEGNATGLIRNVTLSGYQIFDNARHGPILRNIQNLNIPGSVFYQGVSPLLCMDVDNTVHGMSWRNSLFQVCSITSFLGQKKIVSADLNTGQVLPNWAMYASNLDSGTLIAPSGVQIVGGTITALTGLAIRDTSAAFDLTVAATSSSALSAGRSLTFDVVNGSRTVKLGSNLTIVTDPGAITGALKSNGSGTFSQASCSDLTVACLTTNQTITLSGDATGSGTTAITVTNVNLPTGVTVAGNLLHTNIAAPGTPAAGKDIVWTDSTDLRFHDKNSAGVIGTTVVADTGAANNYISAISAAGVITKTRPACATLSDASAFCNGTNVSGLTGTTLPASIISSSLTSLGTIGTGTWQGTVVGSTYGGTGVNNGSSTITLGGSLTHAGAFATTITATATTNSTLPAGTHTLAGLDVAQTFTAAQIINVAGSTQLTTRSSGLNASFIIIDTGAATQQAGFTLLDNGTTQWQFIKQTNQHFLIFDNVNAITAMDVTPGVTGVGNFAFGYTKAATSKTSASVTVAGGLGVAGAIFTDTLNVITMGADTAQVDSTVCRVAASGLLLTGSGTLGICLGTSGAQFKTAFAPMVGDINDIVRLDFQNYRYRKGFGDSGARMQYGLTAQNVDTVLPDLVRHDASGQAINFDSGALLFIGLRAIQQLKAENDNIQNRLAVLENRKSVQ